MRTGRPIYILADDLTGAADAANYFRTENRRVRVSFSPSTPWVFSLDAQVVQVFDSESRVLDEDAALRRVHAAGEALQQTLGSEFHLFKKIDSTLRGHIGSEIEALLKAADRQIALLAPAFPANGRTVENGALLVNGIPITQTAFARDPKNPVLQDKVCDIVGQSTSLPVVEVSGDVIAAGSQAIAKVIDSVSHPRAILVVDASTDADLAVVAEAIAHHPAVLPCGSAGLAKHLAAAWDCEHETASSEAPTEPVPGSCSRVLIAVGSANPVAHEQLRYAASALQASTVELKPARLAKVMTHADELQAAKQALNQLSNRSIIGISLATERARRDPGLEGTFESDLAEVVVHGFQTFSTDPNRSVGFIATGGDTALALCEELQASAIWPEEEVVCGVPWSWIETAYGRFPLITKAGGFGNSDALQTAAKFLLADTLESKTS